MNTSVVEGNTSGPYYLAAGADSAGGAIRGAASEGARAGLAGWRERLEAELRLCAPSAAAASKGLIAAVAGRPIDDALMAETARRLSEQRASADATEGVGAFLARRKPAWTEGGGA